MVTWVFGYGSLIWKAGFPYEERRVGCIKGYRRVFYQGSTDHRGTPEFPGRTVTIEPHHDHVCWGVAYKISGKEAEEAALDYLEVREKQYDQKVYLDVYTGGFPHASVPEMSKRTLPHRPKLIGRFETSDPLRFVFSPKPLQRMGRMDPLLLPTSMVTSRKCKEIHIERLSSWDLCTLTQEADATKPAISGVLVYIASSDEKANINYLGPAPVDVMAREIVRARGPSGSNIDYVFKLEEALHDIGRPDRDVAELSRAVREALKLNDKKDLTI